MYYSLTIISLIEVVLVLVPALVGIAYVTVAERKTMASMQRRLGPVRWLGKSSNIWEKLSNPGDTLELQVPSNNLKVICGWTNYSDTVTSLKTSEKNVGNRGSKSVVLENTTVKEQRVYGSWCGGINVPRLRYTLMGFERNYPVKIPSNQINKLKYYSTDSNKGSEVVKNWNNSLNPYFVTGFSDAESSFIILVLKEPKNKTGWTIKTRFTIGLHKKDKSSFARVN